MSHGDGIFISYRRKVDAGFAQALQGRLETAFPHRTIFIDVDSIPIGADFQKVIDERIAECGIVVAIIGPNWLEAAGPDGQRRIDNPNDFVRVELETALSRSKKIIPVLLNDTEMPRQQDLPTSLHPILKIHAARIRQDRFKSDAIAFARSIGSVSSSLDPQALLSIAGKVGAFAFGLFAITFFLQYLALQNSRDSFNPISGLMLIIWAGSVTVLPLIIGPLVRLPISKDSLSGVAAFLGTAIAIATFLLLAIFVGFPPFFVFLGLVLGVAAWTILFMSAHWIVTTIESRRRRPRT